MVKLLNSKLRSGQGLLEGLVAIGVLVTGLVSVVTLTTSNLAASQDSGYRLTAVNLAREGVEVVRSVRDGNWLKGRMDEAGASSNSWDVGLVGSDPADTTAVPVLDPATMEWVVDFGGDAIIDEASVMVRDQGLYQQHVPRSTSGYPTPFRRLLTLYPICQDNVTGKEEYQYKQCPAGYTKIGLSVLSAVLWNSGSSRARSVTIEDRLYNWRFSPAP